MSVRWPGSMRGSQVKSPLFLLLLLFFLLLLKAGTGKLQRFLFLKAQHIFLICYFCLHLSWAVISLKWWISNFSVFFWPVVSSLRWLFETLNCTGFWLLVFHSPTVVFCLNELFQWPNWIVSSHSEIYSRNKQFTASHTCLWLTAEFCNSRHFVTAAWTRFHGLYFLYCVTLPSVVLIECALLTHVSRKFLSLAAWFRFE